MERQRSSSKRTEHSSIIGNQACTRWLGASEINEIDGEEMATNSGERRVTLSSVTLD